MASVYNMNANPQILIHGSENGVVKCSLLKSISTPFYMLGAAVNLIKTKFDDYYIYVEKSDNKLTLDDLKKKIEAKLTNRDELADDFKWKITNHNGDIDVSTEADIEAEVEFYVENQNYFKINNNEMKLNKFTIKVLDHQEKIQLKNVEIYPENIMYKKTIL